jgi:hypothetical protein
MKFAYFYHCMTQMTYLYGTILFYLEENLQIEKKTFPWFIIVRFKKKIMIQSLKRDKIFLW